MLEQLWQEKENAWASLDTITYRAIMEDPRVSSILENISMDLSASSLVHKVRFGINFSNIAKI